MTVWDLSVCMLDMKRSLVRDHRGLVFFTACIVFLITLISYLTTLTHVHTFDALSYVLDVDGKHWTDVLHPHHLAYGPLGSLIHGMLDGIGVGGSVLVPLQIVNALAGASGVAMFFALVQRITRRVDLALCGALLLGSSYAYWYYAIEVEVYTIAALFLIICLWLMVELVQQPAPSRKLYITLGCVQGMAVLFHQTNVLLCVPITLAMVLGARRHSSRMLSLRLFFAYVVPFVCITAGSYVVVGFGVHGLRSWDKFVEWMMFYAHVGWWGGPVIGEKWVDLGKGLSDTLAQPGGALLGLLLLGLLVLYLRRLLAGYAYLVATLFVWLASYGAFFMWWEPDNIEFWIASLPPFILLLMLALGTGERRSWQPGVWVAGAIGITLWGVNYDAIAYRGDCAYDDYRRITDVLVEHSMPEDLLLVADGLQELYLPYYGDRVHVWSINKAMFEGNGDFADACDLLHEQVFAAQARGAAVLVAEHVLYPVRGGTQFSDPVLERFELSQEEVTRCFGPYISDVMPLPMGSMLPMYYRLPTAQELAEGRGWHFEHTQWGWQAVNVGGSRFAGGWEFVPGVDPILTSPPLVLDLSDYEAIEIRLAATFATTATAKLELFYRNEQGLVEGAYAVQRTLKDGDEARTYGITIAGRPGWSGTITGLRLDPVGVGVGDGGYVRLEWVRLISVAEAHVAPPLP